METKRDKGRSLKQLPRDYTIIDIETSGFSPATDHIIEVGCVKCRDGREVNRYTSLLRPPSPISSTIVNITGITNEMLVTAPTFLEIAAELWEYLQGETLVGHNVNFDVNFLYDNFLRETDRKLRNDYVDTVKLCRESFPTFKSHSLGVICSELGINIRRHRALSDCLIVLKVIERMQIHRAGVADVKKSAIVPISLMRGQKIDLTKNNPALKHLSVGLGWQISGGDLDIDATAFLLDSSGKATREDDVIFYNNRKHGSGSVEHLGRAQQFDAEQLRIDLLRVPSTIHKIDVTLTIYEGEKRKQNFRQVENAYIRLLDADQSVELARFDLGNEFTLETAIVMGELYRYGQEWKFHAIGTGFSGGLAALVRNFGLKTKNGKMEQMTVSLLPEVKADIKRLAALRQCSMSDIVSEAVGEYLSARRQDIDKYEEWRLKMCRA